MIRILGFFFLIFISVNNIWAFTRLPDDSTRTRKSTDSVRIFPKYENKYYADYSNNLDLFLYGKQKYNSFNVAHPTNGQILEYSPNQQLNLGFGFHYKFLGVGIAMKFGFVNHDDDKYGKTKRLDWQTNVYMQKAVFDFYFQYYSNFYLVNTPDIIPGWKAGDPYYVRPDMASVTLGLGGMYVFNHKRFSYKAAFVQTAVQKKSSGSYMLGASVFLQGIMGDSSIFPENTPFDTLNPVKSHSGLYFGIINAYAYNFVIRQRFFVSLSLSGTIQLGKVASAYEDGSLNVGFVPILHIQPRIAFGYNSKKWYTGFSMVKDTYFEIGDPAKDELVYGFASGNFRFYVGMRFGWLSKHSHIDK